MLGSSPAGVIRLSSIHRSTLILNQRNRVQLRWESLRPIRLMVRIIASQAIDDEFESRMGHMGRSHSLLC